MEQHGAKLVLEAAAGPSWREMSWGERVEASLRVILGSGDELVSVIASQVIPRKVKWLWPNRVPLGKLTLFVGDPDKGKSLVATDVTATVTTGRDWFGAENSLPPSEVLIFASEDDPEDTTVPRLLAAGANLSKVHFAKMRARENNNETAMEREMRLDKDIETIEKFLADNPQIRVVVIDPVSNHLGNTEMNKEQEVRRALTPLQQLAAKRSVTILGIMHLNKKEDSKATNRVGGAMAFVGVARAVWLFAVDREKPGIFHMVQVKKNIGKRVGGLMYRIDTKPVQIEGGYEQEPCVEWLGETDKSADEMLAAKPAGRPPNERKDASEWLKVFLADGPKPSKEVQAQGEAAGITYRTLERVKDEPNSGVGVFREDDKWNWKLTE